MRVALALAMLSLGVAIRAPAQGWEPAVDISSAGQDATDAQIAFSSSGPTRTAVWQRHDGSNWRVQAAEWLLGSWQPAADLSEPGHDAGNAQIAYMQQSPTRTAVWQSHQGTNWDVQAAEWLQGSWQPATTLRVAPRLGVAEDAVLPEIAYMPLSPTRTAVWQRHDGSSWRIHAAEWLQGSWQVARTLSRAGHDALRPRIAYTPLSPARTAVWQRHDGSNWRIQAAEWLQGRWQPPVNLSGPGQDALNAEIEYSPQSPVRTVVWQRHDGSSWRVQAAMWLQGSWQAAVTLSAEGQDAVEPQVAAGTFGPIVVWRQFDGANWRIVSAARIGGTWETPVTLSAAGQDASHPAIGVGLGPCFNLTIALWGRSDGTSRRIEAAVRRAVEPWRPAETISAPEGDAERPCVDFVESSVYATAVWQRHDGDNWRIQAANRVGESCAETGQLY